MLSGSIAYPIGQGVIVVVGGGLMLAAGRWRWKPSLPVMLLVALAFRAGLFALAIHRSWQPIDFFRDFQIAGDRVLHGQDPLTSTRTQGWNYLPLMAYVFAAQLKLGALVGLSWPTIGRVVPILADIGLAVVVGRLAGSDGEIRRFQYACCPLALMVSAVHGQMEPLTLLLAASGLMLAGRGRPAGAGALVACAIAAKSWPVLVVPALLRSLRTPRQWVAAGAGGAVVLVGFFASLAVFLGESSVHRMVQSIRVILRYRSITGTWGWTGVWQLIVGHGRAQDLSGAWGRIGTILTVVSLLAAIAIWRRAHPVDLASVLIVVFLVVTSGFGAQYLLWPVPFLLARPTRFSLAAIVVASMWAGYGYFGENTIKGQALGTGHQWWVGLSVVVIASLLAALPWRRLKADDAVEPVAVAPPRHRAVLAP